MRTLSPIRSLSPGPKPKIVFNYQPSPLRERPSTTNPNHANLTPSAKLPLMVSPNARSSHFLNLEKETQAESRCFSCPKQVGRV
jgi:hypothetical protein